MEFKSSFRVSATLIPNEFIDIYMANASGEYIKEYLYLLRHDGEAVTLSAIADALNHTESDVARALTYWKKAGILEERTSCEEKRPEGIQPEVRAGGAGTSTTAADPASAAEPESVSIAAENTVPYGNGAAESSAKTPRAVYSMEQISGLAGDEDFSQLLYIAQKYLNKVFTQRECEVFAYLYDGLHMTAEFLEYVVEYCVQGGHTSIRYIETVAVNWHEKGLKTVEEAKSHASSFSKDTFAVMKAFGLNDRNPAATEREMIDRWFRSYGFTKELVLEACNRTIEATHAPSFKYADKILSEWKKACVRTLEDVKHLDEKRQERGAAKSQNAQNTQNSQNRKSFGGGRGSQNQFQNFPQRDIDYDALVLQQLKEQ